MTKEHLVRKPTAGANMTFEEGMNKFKHDVEEVFHEVEEAFHEVKEHMILSVRDYSFQIAFFLMAVTSAVLVIGTVYVWCFHHPKNPHADESEAKKSSKKDRHAENVIGSTNVLRENSVESNKNEQGGMEDEEETREQIIPENEERKTDQNGQVEIRKRISSSSGVNNNVSPIKSKIPIRMKSKSS